MSPLRIEVGSWMLSDHFAFGFPSLNEVLNAVANRHDHVAERFKGSALSYFSSRRNNLDSAVSPWIEGLQKAIECAPLRIVDLRVTVTRKYLAQIDQRCDVEMHEGIRITVSGFLVNDVNGFPIKIKGQYPQRTLCVDARLPALRSEEAVEVVLPWCLRPSVGA